jgi:uncharacterized protein
MHTFTWEKLEFKLLKERAVFMPEHRCLLIADTHFGKAAHFRKAGIPIPENLHLEDLLKIEALIQKWNPSSIYFLGDLFHSDINESWFVLEDFLNQFKDIKLSLIKGNHDVLPPAIYASSRWQIIPESLELGSLLLTHEPLAEVPLTKFNLCGHIHPGIRLHGNGRQKISLPCYFTRPNQMILPAFGRFTGLHILNCTKNDRAFVVTESRVIEANFEH